jgi:myotubularin-related protein 1/2
MWTYLADLRASGGSYHEHFNPFYDAASYDAPLVPPAAALAPTLWPQFYLRWTCPPESQGGGLESHWHSMSKKYAASIKVLISSLLLFIMQYHRYFYLLYTRVR